MKINIGDRIEYVNDKTKISGIVTKLLPSGFINISTDEHDIIILADRCKQVKRSPCIKKER